MADDGRRNDAEDLPDTPGLREQDWDAVEAASVPPEDGDARLGDKPDGELLDEDDDNAYQESDEALPDDLEEKVLSRDPSKGGGRFDEQEDDRP